MAKSVAARLTRASSAPAIEDDLALLWRDAGRDGPVARAVMANLVVYCAERSDADLDEPIAGAPIEEVARRHPSRVIVLRHDSGTKRAGPIDATISILLFGPPQARFGVEQIAVRSRCAEGSLPSIVRRLALGDLPTSIWWTQDLSLTTPLEALVTMGRQFLYDSRQWRDVRRGVLAIAPLAIRARQPDVADLNWRRLTPMRQALTQALAPPFGSVDVRATRLTIRHRPDEGALAWLLVGWFGSRLGWTAAADFPVSMEETPGGDEALSVSMGTSDTADLTATMNGHRVLVEYRGRAAPLSISVPHETQADAVAGELRNLTFDVGLRDALIALATRFSASA